MTREEAIEQLKWYFEYDNGLSADKETVEAYKMAIKALSAEPCEDAISFPKGTLKKRGKGYVVYNPEWLKENWQTELKVMGVECEDAISRADTIEWLKKVTVTDGITFETGFKQILTDIQNMPSVTPKQKMGHWEHHIILGVEDVPSCSKCGMCQPKYCETNYCPNCGAKMDSGKE